MAKDPAFLFYANDFLTGTLSMSHEDRGKYIYLLCIMHQQGRQDEETIRLMLGSVSDKLKSKFQIDEKGLWYNKRLEEEIEKRALFTNSRRINGSKGGRPKANAKPNGYPSAKPNGKPRKNLPENEDVNENTNIKASSISFSQVEKVIHDSMMHTGLKPIHAEQVWESFKSKEQLTEFENMSQVGRMLYNFIKKSDWSKILSIDTSEWLYSSGPQGPYKYQMINGIQSNLTAVTREEFNRNRNEIRTA